MGRLVDDWIQGYLAYTKDLRSPEIFRRWTAISTVAAALQRRTFLEFESQIQYGNLYVLLVASPAVGKSNAIKLARNEILSEVSTINLAPSDITREAFYIFMEQSGQALEINGHAEMTCSVAGFLDEWSVFIQENDRAFMEFLADVYDNPPSRSYITKGSGENILQHPNFTMLGGVTPRQLRGRFSDDAIEGGFPSRIIMVYSDEEVAVDTGLRRKGSAHRDESQSPRDPELRAQLVHDLESIMTLNGEYFWEDQAIDSFETWKANNYSPNPSDPRLRNYKKRKPSHAVKLAMVISASRRDDLIITEGDFRDAQAILIQAEENMHVAMSALGASDTNEQLKFVRSVVRLFWLNNKRAIPHHTLLQEISSEIPHHQVKVVIEHLLEMKHIAKDISDPTRVSYFPPELQGNSS